MDSREKDIEVWDEYCTGEYNKDIRPNILKHVAANYIKYKKNNNLIDFTDMIHQFIQKKDLCPQFDVVFIDEAQDLSPIQWQMFDILKSNTKDMYLAGDDDQAIYAWAGADVDRFIQEPATEVVLKKSRRVPVQIQDLSNIIVNCISNKKTDDIIMDVSDGTPIKTTDYYLKIYDALKIEYPVFIDYERANEIYDEKRKSFINESRILDVSLMKKIMPSIIKYVDVSEGIEDSLK